MVITISTLYTASRKALIDVIKAGVKDPKRGSNLNRRWIYREFPDTTSNDFSGYPLLVIDSPDIGDDPITLNQFFREDTFTFEIEVYAEFNDEHARVDELSDAITNSILKQTGQNTLADEGMVHPVITGSAFENTEIDSKKLSTRLIRVQFSTELCF